MSAGSENERYGLDLRSGARHYRAWVGPPDEYDVIAALQVSLLFAAGLRETHRMCDVGCGSLRAGRMLIPYLRPGNYFGIEPEGWLVEEGIDGELGRAILDLKKPQFRHVSDFSLEEFGTTFDFVIAQSVFSHTFPDLLRLGLGKISSCLNPSGKLLATWIEADDETGGEPRVGPKAEVFPNGWVRRGGHTYSWSEMTDYLAEAGLVGRKLRWPHPRQSWFVAALPEAEAEIEDLASSIRTPRPGWGRKRSRQERQRAARERRNRAEGRAPEGHTPEDQTPEG